MRKILTICIMSLVCWACCCASRKGSEKKSDIAFMRVELSENEFYVNQVVSMTFWLYSDYPDISFFREVKAPRLEKGEFGYISRADFQSGSRREIINNKEFWAVPVARYFVMVKNSGKYTFDGGEYELGVNVPVVYDDPFYGRIRGVDTRQLKVSPDKTVFNVKNLPKAEESFPFSGAVGEFDVETVVPKGDIIVNEEATAIVVLKGRGLIGEGILPEYREAFGECTKLKSFTERNDIFYDSAGVVSEKEMECVFIPETRDNCRIGVVRFGYFNPRTKKYEIAESTPVEIDVESSAIRSKIIDI